MTQAQDQADRPSGGDVARRRPLTIDAARGHS